jgi:hypothetical protein
MGPGSVGGSPQRKASSSNAAQQQQQQQGEALLQQLTQRWRVLWFKRCVLEHQLSFVARCSAEQTKLVSGLVQRVAAAAAAAAEEFDIAGDMQQRQDEAEQLAGQLLRALLLLEQQGASGSALRAVAGVVQQHRDAVEDLPQVRCHNMSSTPNHTFNVGTERVPHTVICQTSMMVAGW